MLQHILIIFLIKCENDLGVLLAAILIAVLFFGFKEILKKMSSIKSRGRAADMLLIVVADHLYLKTVNLNYNVKF